MAKKTAVAQVSTAAAAEAPAPTLPAIVDVARQLDAATIRSTTKAIANAVGKRHEWGSKLVETLTDAVRHVAALPEAERLASLHEFLKSVKRSPDAEDMLSWLKRYAFTEGALRLTWNDDGHVVVGQPKRAGALTLSDTFRADWYAGKIKGIRERRRADPAARGTELADLTDKFSRFVAQFSPVTREGKAPAPAKYAMGRKAGGQLRKLSKEKEEQARKILKDALEQIADL